MIRIESILKKISEPQTWLEDRVYLLLQHHGIRTPEQIDLHQLCSTYRIEIQMINGRSRTHAHPIYPNRSIIAIDERLEAAEQRVKIAHEWGHLLLHEGIQPQNTEWMIEWQEAQANHFAEHVLMPFYMVGPLLIGVPRYDAHHYLAQLFHVPLPLAKQRYDRFLARMHDKGFPVYM
ncbi:ImmA/IrrE family metallo-endopeptidase [Brevibacillus invocatus]|uniref:ImmA/IrrE family metallo-endopeptidase n=1 Tax=Brevibacillus invocatus TaxID=173959 RepID=UPI001FE61221|nr:ImmA/IrrE family metallo-endopeptidase [Brevibacillus invocatus]